MAMMRHNASGVPLAGAPLRGASARRAATPADGGASRRGAPTAGRLAPNPELAGGFARPLSGQGQ